ncbi:MULTISPECIES: DUF1572 family protein [unclassified Flavobacterium]|uniref:DUF1572 family protein n=1 Tax=unclassified Flavobacterium TaxID=196869 RepID=UPI003F8E045B
MLTSILKEIYARDLNKLKEELNAYTNEVDLWLIGKHISNSGGNLSLHLIGNLKTYIGAALGGQKYTRNRPEEFSLKNIARDSIIKQIDEVIQEINTVLDHITEPQLIAEYPIFVFEKPTSTAYMLTHLASHLNYHLGQINYHRRLLA